MYLQVALLWTSGASWCAGHFCKKKIDENLTEHFVQGNIPLVFKRFIFKHYILKAKGKNETVWVQPFLLKLHFRVLHKGNGCIDQTSHIHVYGGLNSEQDDTKE